MFFYKFFLHLIREAKINIECYLIKAGTQDFWLNKIQSKTAVSKFKSRTVWSRHKKTRSRVWPGIQSDYKYIYLNLLVSCNLIECTLKRSLANRVKVQINKTRTPRARFFTCRVPKVQGSIVAWFGIITLSIGKLGHATYPPVPEEVQTV